MCVTLIFTGTCTHIQCTCTYVHTLAPLIQLSKALSSQVSGLLCRLHRSDHAHLTLHSLLQQTSSECQRLVRGQQQRAEQLLQQVETLQNEVGRR